MINKSQLHNTPKSQGKPLSTICLGFGTGTLPPKKKKNTSKHRVSESWGLELLESPHLNPTHHRGRRPPNQCPGIQPYDVLVEGGGTNPRAENGISKQENEKGQLPFYHDDARNPTDQGNLISDLEPSQPRPVVTVGPVATVGSAHLWTLPTFLPQESGFGRFSTVRFTVGVCQVRPGWRMATAKTTKTWG